MHHIYKHDCGAANCRIDCGLSRDGWMDGWMNAVSEWMTCMQINKQTKNEWLSHWCREAHCLVLLVRQLLCVVMYLKTIYRFTTDHVPMHYML